MLGSDGSAWLERLHMQLARNLKAASWSQADIADILGSTQSTVSRMAHRDLPNLQGTSDESTIDSWADMKSQWPLDSWGQIPSHQGHDL